MKIVATLVIIHTLLVLTKSQDVDYLEVSLVEQGDVRGFRSEDGKRFRFLGIPYAAPPTGQNRFKPPLPPPTWNGVLNATRTVMCPQMYHDGNYIGSEDCLIINVFVPASAHLDDKLSVLAYVHGGGYIEGVGIDITSNRLIDQDIIIVTMNYRLGALGFLCLHTDEAPGNAGLKDLVAALRWVKKNISKFGGNPDDVTLYGNSAGSVLVELLALSKATEGLIHKVILESGSAIAPWAVNYDPVGAAVTIAGVMGYENVDSVEALIDVYRNVEAEHLVTRTFQKLVSLLVRHLFFPCIERNMDNTTVIVDAPMNVLESGDYNRVPIIVAYMDMEAIMHVPEWNDGWYQVFDERIADFLYPDLVFPNDEERTEVGEKIKQFYLERRDNDLEAFIDFQTDLYFTYSAIRAVELHAANSVPVYLMEFSYHDSSSDFAGASHSDLLIHLFEIELKGTGGEMASDRITTLFGNFIKYGNPVPTTSTLLPVSWPTVSHETVNYLRFGEDLSVGQSPLPERYELWSDIYRQYYNELPVHGQDPGSGQRLTGASFIILFLGFFVILNKF